MDGNHGFHINRFDETLNAGGMTQDQLDTKLTSFQTDFRASAASTIKEMKDHLSKTDDLVKSISVSKSYISLGGKRIVTVGRPKDKNDVVTKIVLDERLEPINKLVDNIKPTKSLTPGKHDALEIQNHHRISKVSRSVDNHDVVVKIELDELNNKLVEFQTAINTQFTTIQKDLNDLKSQVSSLNDV